MAEEENFATIDDFKDMMTLLEKKSGHSFKHLDDVKVVETPMEGVKLKIKEGYLYSISNGSWFVQTGWQGAFRFVDTFRAYGHLDEAIGNMISIDGFPLNSIEWKNKTT
jgi:hypothetical protein